MIAVGVGLAVAALAALVRLLIGSPLGDWPWLALAWLVSLVVVAVTAVVYWLIDGKVSGCARRGGVSSRSAWSRCSSPS
jgi:hypothetical protein